MKGKNIMKNYTFSIKALSAIMTILVLIASLPMSVFASELRSLFEEDAEISQVSDGVSNVEGENTGLLAIDPFEITELREEYVKYFRNSDGNYVAAQYDSPVHTLDENGKWQDIDNSLSLSGNELSTKDSRIKFAKKLNGNNELFTLKEGNTKLSLSLDGANKKAEGSVITEDESSMTKLQKLMNLESLNARVIYTEALDNVDIEYIAASGSVKENIIVKSRLDSYVFSFTMKLSGLYAQLSRDGSVEICNSSDESLQYIIPAPVAFDASGELADDSEVYYTLTQTGNKEYSLSVTVSDSWMNDSSRVFPVTIDPPIHSASSTSNSESMFVNELYPTSGYYNSTSMCVGFDANGYESVSFWRVMTLPTLPEYAHIVSATADIGVYTFKNYATVTRTNIGAYLAIDDWTSGVTWNTVNNNTKGKLGKALDYQKIVSSMASTEDEEGNIV